MAKSIEEKGFEAAVKVMRNLPEDGSFMPSEDMLIRFYSYHKQATCGPCNTRKPSGWSSSAKTKWEAWKALGDMSKDQAMQEYVQEIKLILETLPVTEDVAGLLDVLEPFYELVDDENEVITSRPETSDSIDEGAEDGTNSSDEDSVVDLELEKLSDGGGGVLLNSDSVEQSVNKEGSEAAGAHLAHPGARNREEPRQNSEDRCMGVDENPETRDRGSVRGRGFLLAGNAVPPCGENVPSDQVGTKPCVDTRVAELLGRLQEDMQSVLERLNTLESLKRSHVQTSAHQHGPCSDSARKILWHQLDGSPISVAFLLVWPLAVNWLVQLYQHRKRSGR